MASIGNILICAGLAVVVYSFLGLPLMLRIVPRWPALMLAPATGWAVHSVLALPLAFAIGLSRTAVIAMFAAPLIAAAVSLWRFRPGDAEPLSRAAALAVGLALAGAALLALMVMAAVVPKISADGVLLAAPIFDHSKVAMIDEMTRLGVPPGNPFFGETGSPLRLSYYYLWHFSAAEISMLAHGSGWEADAGLTWFTAFASLAVMMGLAIWLSGRAGSALWVVALAATASLRPLLDWLIDDDIVQQIVGYQSGFGGWLFQTSWAPQHTASAMAAVLAIFFMVQTIRRQSAPTVVLLALAMAAAFESSTWVGGIVLPLAAILVAPVMLALAAPDQRLRIVVCLAIAALLAVLLISPFLYDQLRMTALRGDGSPVRIEPYGVLGEDITDLIGDNVSAWAGALANMAAYWLIFLVVEFPAFYLTGLVALFYVLKDRALPPERKAVVIAFALLLAASLGASWLLVSTLGDNNDLGWRAVLPGMMLLIVLAAVGLSRLLQKPPSAALVAAVAVILLGVPDAAMIGYGNIVAAPNATSKAFAATPALWQAVRRVTAADERIGNNPSHMEHATPWGVNISWALLANRRSCYAGIALVGPFSALSKARQAEVDALFIRVFAGAAQPGEVEQLATHYHCSTAVVTPEDGAWNNDPFATSALYRLAEGGPNWRIYRTVAAAPL